MKQARCGFLSLLKAGTPRRFATERPEDREVIVLVNIKAFADAKSSVDPRLPPTVEGNQELGQLGIIYGHRLLLGYGVQRIVPEIARLIGAFARLTSN